MKTGASATGVPSSSLASFSGRSRVCRSSCNRYRAVSRRPAALIEERQPRDARNVRSAVVSADIVKIRRGSARARYDLDDALTELTASVTAVLGLCGSGVTLADDGRMRYVTTVTLASAELERDHAQPHPCPCRDVYATGEVVRVMDIREESALARVGGYRRPCVRGRCSRDPDAA